MYIWRLLKIFCGAFLWKACQTMPPCQNFLTCQPAKPGKYYHKNPKILTKRSPVATTVLSGMNTVTGALLYRLYIKKLNWQNYNIVCISMYIWWLLKFVVVLFLWKGYQNMLPCQNFPIGQPAKPVKYYKKTPHNINKTTISSHHCSP